MVKNLRPREAAEALGIGLSTFWLKAKTDPDFPALISLGPKATVVREADLEAYVEKKGGGEPPGSNHRNSCCVSGETAIPASQARGPSLTPRINAFTNVEYFSMYVIASGDA